MGLLDFKGGGPIGLKGLLAQQFDPREMRYQAGSNALTQFGIGLMNPDPRAPNAWLSGLGRGVAGAAQGAQQGKEDFYNQGLQNLQLMDYQREQDTRDQKTAALNEFMQSDVYKELDPTTQSFFKYQPDAAYETLMKAKVGGTNEFGIQPVWTQDANGKYHLFQSDKAGGKPREMDFGGYNPVPGTTYLDTGTGFVPAPTKGIAPDGGIGTTVPKNVADVEAEKKRGDAIGAYRSMSSKMPGVEAVVKQLDDLAGRATYTGAGQGIDIINRQLGLSPRDSAVARASYISIVNNQILPLLRDTFGAQFTEREGDTLRATLGDPNLSPQEKQTVLKSFIEQKRRDVEAQAAQAGLASQPTQNQGGTAPAGVSQDIWDEMTPEERSHWQN